LKIEIKKIASLLKRGRDFFNFNFQKEKKIYARELQDLPTGRTAPQGLQNSAFATLSQGSTSSSQLKRSFKLSRRERSLYDQGSQEILHDGFCLSERSSSIDRP
jgi:hypothetical protein